MSLSDDFTDLPTTLDTSPRMNEDILNKTRDIQALLARIEKIRFDVSRDQNEVARTVKNLIQEVRRLEAEVSKLYKKQLCSLERSLDLGAIGLSPTQLTDGRKLLVSSKKIESDAAPSSTAQLTDSDDTLTEEEMQELKLMKTESTGALEGKPAKNKWQSLFKMFQEWRRETSIAQGQYVLHNSATDFLDEEIVKVRAAVLSLQQKKALPESEQMLLADLQQRLQQLLRAQRTLANSASQH